MSDRWKSCCRDSGEQHGAMLLVMTSKRSYTIILLLHPIAAMMFLVSSRWMRALDHRVNCRTQFSDDNFAYRIVKAVGKERYVESRWHQIKWIDDVGLVNKITTIISHEHNVNMRAISFESHDGIFEGKVMAFVHDTDHLNSLMDKLKRVRGVRSVERVDQ